MRRLRSSDLILLAIGAGFWPVHIMAANPVGIVHPERMVALIAALWALAVTSTWLLVRRGFESTKTVAGMFLVTVVSMRGMALVQWADALSGYLILALGVVGLLVVIGRTHHDAWLSAVIWAVAVALATGPAIAFFDEQTARGENLVSPSTPVDVTMRTTPDIYLVVFDAYPGLIAAEQDGPEPAITEIAEKLGAMGFHLPESAWTSYWTTTLALPAVLDMGYPVTQEWEGSATVAALFELLSGAGSAYQLLADNGYTTHIIESGWTGSTCGEVDRCVPSPFIDEAMYLALRGSIVAPLFDGFAGPFVEGTVAGMAALKSELPALASNDTPDFLFTHLMAPHPPFFLDPECGLEIERGRAGTDFNLPGVSTEQRDAYLQEQIRCVNKFMVELAGLVGEEQVLIFMADHGMDRRFQADATVIDWEREAIVERMNVLVAIRAPDCQIANRLVTPNLMRLLISCYSDSPIDTNPNRIWINPMDELDRQFVEQLIGGGDVRPEG